MICNIDTDVLKVVLQAQAKLRISMPTEASYPILWDSGASVSVSNDAADFQGTLPWQMLPQSKSKVSPKE